MTPPEHCNSPDLGAPGVGRVRSPSSALAKTAGGGDRPQAERSVSDWLRTRSASSVAYNERLADVYDGLFRQGFSTVGGLRLEVGGSAREVTAKLQALERLGLVYYERDGAEWHVEEE